jgi:23S rRNA pseudouridine1911/1915/1917 synthase
MKERRVYRLQGGLEILYEDREIIAVNKPSGLLTTAAGAERDKTAYWLLCEYLRKKGEKRRVAVVHRLDRDTSGVLVFAKSEAAKRTLMDNWNEAVIERRYVALAEGDFPSEAGTIDEPLGEDRGGRAVVVERGTRGALEAVTRWRVLGAGNGYTLVELELETGRRNQIRAHLDWAGRPVAGDKKYGARTNPVGRLALHAEKLAVRHPADGRIMEFEVPAPAEFERALRGRRGENRPISPSRER